MLASVLDSLALLAVAATLAFAGCAQWALRRGPRELAGLVFAAAAVAGLLPYLVVPALGLLADSPVVRPLVVLAAGQTAGITAAVTVRRATGRIRLPAG